MDGRVAAVRNWTAKRPGQIAAAALFLIVSFVSRVVVAQDEGPVDGTDKQVASKTFASATRAYRAGDFLVAARAFEVAYRLAPHPNAAYNAGIAWDDGGRPGRAADNLTEALAGGDLPPQMMEDAETRLARLLGVVGRIEVSAPSGARVDVAHVAGVEAPRTVHVAPGTYEVRVVFADGSQEEQRVTVAATDTMPVVFRRAEGPGPVDKLEKPFVDLEETRDEEAGMSSWYLGGAVATGIGVVAGGAAIGVGVMALSARDTFVDTGETDAAARREASNLRTATNVLWLVAGLGTVTGVTLITIGAVSGDDAGGAEVSVGMAPMGFLVRGRF
ncbi:MAG: hypothetical protein AAF928_16380 [Myxococcota bacterium]